MLNKYSLWALAAGSVVLLASGCSQKEPSTSASPDNAGSKPASQVAAVQPNAGEAQAPSVEKSAPQQPRQEATAVAATTSSPAGKIADSARSDVAKTDQAPKTATVQPKAEPAKQEVPPSAPPVSASNTTNYNLPASDAPKMPEPPKPPAVPSMALPFTQGISNMVATVAASNNLNTTSMVSAVQNLLATQKLQMVQAAGITNLPAGDTPKIPEPPKPPAVQSMAVPFTQGISNMAATVAASNNLSTNSLMSAVQSLLGTQKLQTAQAVLGITNPVQAAGTVTNQVQSLIERAKSLFTSQKYQEALGTVQQLYTNKLTSTQQQTVDNLAANIQTAIKQQVATNAASILGNIFGGKK